MTMIERKLLPYEHGLIDALGVTKEEYLEFVAIQHEYKDAKVGTDLDIRGVGADIALILTIVGTILQVIGALLLEEPEAVQNRTRDQRFAPRFGFNSSQELAKYGDPVPIVYTNVNHNRSGGVRVSGALLWSAVLSYGSSQFMQLMMTIGASKILEIVPERTAIGQLSFRDVVRSRVWLYYNENGPTGYDDFVEGSSSISIDAARSPSTDPTTRRNQRTATLTHLVGDRRGFSQSYAPSSGASCGITGVVPINAAITRIFPSGNLAPAQLVPVRLLEAGSKWPVTNNRPAINKGETITVIIQSTKSISDRAINDGRKQALRGAASVFDEGSLYKLGSAIFRIQSIQYQRDGRGITGDIDDGALRVELICEERGVMPAIDYNIVSPQLDGALNNIDAQIADRENAIDAIESQISLIETLATKDPTRLAALEKNEDDITKKENQIQKNRGRIERGSLTKAQVNALKGENDKLKEQIEALDRKNARLLTGQDLKDWEDPAKLRRRQESLRETVDQLEQSKVKVKDIDVNKRLGFKALARIEQAVYSSVTKCSVVELALRSKVFTRLSGRQLRYGTQEKNYGYDSVENGTQPRTCMFLVEYSINGKDDKYVLAPYIFCIRSSADQDSFSYLRFLKKEREAGGIFQVYSWTFRLTPVLEPQAEERKRSGFQGYCYIKPNANARSINVGSGADAISIEFNGSIQDFSEFPYYNETPRGINEWDLFNYDMRSQSQFSFEQSPEIIITAANEQFFDDWKAYNENDKLYRGLSTLAVHAFSGRGFQDLRNITTWVTQGKELRQLSVASRDYDNESKIDNFLKSDPNGCSSYAPDIFVDTVLDKDNGIGNFARPEALDFETLAKTKLFCQANELFMDGAIVESGSWREFWARVAGFSLLEMARIGGKETLVPAVPSSNAGQFLSSTPLAIDSLFNQGNIMEGSFKEEYLDYGANVQDAVITAIYRDVEDQGYFPRNNSIEMRLKGVSDGSAIRESIDLSQYVTTKRQAQLVARFLVLSRRLFRKAFEWQTLPSETFIQPGSFVYLDVGLNDWDGVYTGMIMDGGELNLPTSTTPIVNGSYDFLTHKSGNKPIKRESVQVVNGVAPALADKAGHLFVLGRPGKASKKVVRVTDISMDEEGLVTVKGVEHPVDDNGVSLLAKRIVDASLFKEQ
jgi:hypothetical protein